MDFFDFYIVFSWAVCGFLVWWQIKLPDFRTPIGIAAIVLELIVAPIFMPVVFVIFCLICLVYAFFITLDALFSMPSGDRR